MKIKWDTVFTVVLLICAVVTTGLVVCREFFAPTVPAAPSQKPVFIAGWRAHLDKGVRLGSPSSPVQLIEFADVECPFCARFHENLKALRQRYPTQVSLTYIHSPLPMHRFAVPAARAAECAGKQGRFEAMLDRLFEEQNSLGLRSWSDYAVDARTPDLAAFHACVKNTAPVPEIEAGKQLSKELDIQGTPTLIVNGWKLGRPPAGEELDRMVKAILAGKNPVISDGKHK